MKAHKQTCRHTSKHAGTQTNTSTFLKDNSNRTVFFLYYYNFYKSFGSICALSRNTKVQISFKIVNAFLMENTFLRNQKSSPMRIYQILNAYFEMVHLKYIMVTCKVILITQKKAE